MNLKKTILRAPVSKAKGIEIPKLWLSVLHSATIAVMLKMKSKNKNNRSNTSSSLSFTIHLEMMKAPEEVMTD